MRLVLQKAGLQLVGAFGRRAHRVGMDVGQAIGLETPLGIALSADLHRVAEETRPDVAIQATCSTAIDALSEITTLIQHNVNVISIAEEMVYPQYSSPAIAEQLHWQAVKQGVAVLGTGVNPGFVLDLLVITLSGVCANIQSISAKRVNDLSPYGPSVLGAQGVGLSPQAFQQGVKNGIVVGHYGFKQSIHMIAKAVGWEIEEITESREPIIASVQHKTPFVSVAPGQVVGCNHTAVAYLNDRPVITLLHPQQVQPQLEGVATGDSINIKGTPDINLSGSPEIPGGIATAAIALNSIPRLLNAASGLYSMADLPVPAAMLADVRHFLAEEMVEVSYD